jgi:hypothetical protein
MPTYKFKGKIHTDFNGYCELLDFYNFCKNNHNTCITIDWSELEILDANLSAVLCGMMHKLKKENNLSFFLDVKQLNGGLSIFWRNRFVKYILKSKIEPQIDDRQSVIPLKAFKVEHFDNYCTYIEKELLQHRGIDLMRFRDKEKVKDSYLELFNNYEIHSETDEAILCCGQYFPVAGELKFTMVDLGCGFLKKIAEYTKDTDKIEKCVDAIQWAIRGGSTKVEAKGGTGLKKMLFYCKSSASSIHIISDNTYWKFDNTITNHWIDKPFLGTTIHLIMRYS